MPRTACIETTSRPRRHRTAACVTLLALISLQNTTRAQIAVAQDLYAQAIAMPATDMECQAEHLYRALRAAQQCPGRSSAEKALMAKIKQSLSEIDPLALDRLQAQEQGAKKLLASARDLANAGRVMAATKLMGMAIKLDAGVDEKLIAEIKAKQAIPNALLLSTFVDASYPYQGDSWKISEAGITSPTPQKGAQNVTTMLQSGRTLIGDYRLTIEVLSSRPTAIFGIALGVQGKGSSYHLLSFVHAGDQSRVTIDRFARKSWEKLAIQPMQIDAMDQEEWFAIEIVVQGARLSASVNGAAPLVVETETNLDGALGFFLAQGNANTRATSFRHLKIESIQ